MAPPLGPRAYPTKRRTPNILQWRQSRIFIAHTSSAGINTIPGEYMYSVVSSTPLGPISSSGAALAQTHATSADKTMNKGLQNLSATLMTMIVLLVSSLVVFRIMLMRTAWLWLQSAQGRHDRRGICVSMLIRGTGQSLFAAISSRNSAELLQVKPQ